jgi:type VI secretion system secreted protein VgrG
MAISSATRGKKTDKGASASHMALSIGDLKGAGLTVESFRTGRHVPNEPFTWQVQLRTRRTPGLSMLMHKPAHLTVRAGARQVGFSGRVTGIQDMGPAPDGGRRLQLDVCCPLHSLQTSHHQRVFVDRPIRDVVEALFETGGDGIEVTDWAVDGNGPRSAQVTQYQESDLHLLQRMLCRAGWLVDFAAEPGSAALRITPSLADLGGDTPPLRLSHIPDSGQVATGEAILSVATRSTRVSHRFHVATDNPEELGARLEARASGDKAGEELPAAYHYGRGEDYDAVDHEAFHRSNHAAAQAEGLLVSTDCCALRPGITVQLSGVSGLAGDQAWRVVEVHHEGSQRHGLEGGGDEVKSDYLNHALLIPAETDWRPPWVAAPDTAGSFTAVVEGDAEDVAGLDEEGCYRLRYGFDRDTPQGSEASRPVRRLQPYGGDGHGMHLPLLPGTPVAVGALNGDPDHPVILGALPDSQHPSPVTRDNNTENILRTVAGHFLRMEDASGEEAVELATGGGERLLLDARESAPRLALESPRGDIDMEAAGNLNIETAENIHTQIGGDAETRIEGKYTLVTTEGNIETRSAGELLLHADEADPHPERAGQHQPHRPGRGQFSG